VCLVPKEHAGKAIRCPGCKQTFAFRTPEAPATPPPLPPASANPTVVAPSSARTPFPAVELPPLPPAVPPVPVRARCLDVGSATSPGRVRTRNEDGLLVQRLSWAGQAGAHEAALAVVADGMGGHDAGDRASAVAVGVMASALAPFLAGLVTGQEKLDDPERMLEALELALWEANRAVSRAAEEEPGCAGMGATAVAAVVVDGLAGICHVGDCRAYLHRGGELRQLTRDQTLVARMIELGTLTEREAKKHPAAHQVSQALGKQYDLEPSRQTLELQAGDRLVLACDGLHAHLDAEALAGVVREGADAAGLAAALVERADGAGGSDNCTVVVMIGKGAAPGP
jgi:protein phosphatase